MTITIEDKVHCSWQQYKFEQAITILKNPEYYQQNDCFVLTSIWTPKCRRMISSRAADALQCLQLNKFYINQNLLFKLTLKLHSQAWQGRARQKLNADKDQKTHFSLTSSLRNKLKKIINNHLVAIKTSVGVSAKFSLTFTNEANPFTPISVITTGCVPVT